MGKEPLTLPTTNLYGDCIFLLDELSFVNKEYKVGIFLPVSQVREMSEASLGSWLLSCSSLTG